MAENKKVSGRSFRGVLGPGVGRAVPGEVILVWGMFWKSVFGITFFSRFSVRFGGAFFDDFGNPSVGQVPVLSRSCPGLVPVLSQSCLTLCLGHLFYTPEEQDENTLWDKFKKPVANRRRISVIVPPPNGSIWGHPSVNLNIFRF